MRSCDECFHIQVAQSHSYRRTDYTLQHWEYVVSGGSEIILELTKP